MIANASVETPGSVATSPLSWQSNKYGSNVATFSYPNTGLDGQRSVRVDMASRSSGDAKWYFNDVPVTPGQKYTFTDMYRSNVLTSATVRYRMSNGSFVYTGYYPAPASATTNRLTFDFTAPANAVSATVFHLIARPGYLVTDAFSLDRTGATPPVDTTAPTICIGAPTANATVSGTVMLAAKATDNVEVAGVRFLVDGVQVGSEITTSPYQIAWNTTTVADGNHSIVAIARDAAGNTTTSTAITVAVKNTVTPPPPPPPAPTPTPVNLVPNPSVELTAANGDPTEWFRSSWGTNSATFNSAVAGFDGARAIRVELSSYSSGDAKWYFNDVPVSAGKTYTFSDAYRSNRESKLVLRYQFTDGTFSYAYVTTLPATSNWTTTTHQIAPPANVVSMTAFHLIEGIGWLETDKYSLSEVTSGGPPPAVGGMISLAFDDGWTSQLQNAVPLLEQADLPATFYIITRANQGGAAWEEVQNRSLESAVNNFPVDWNTWQTGNNNSNFIYATSGSDGVRSGRIDVQSYSSGEAAWYFQDVQVSPDTQYTISHQYNSTAPTSVRVRFTRHDGSVVWVDAGNLNSTNGQWQTQQLNVTAPANADAMTVLHQINQVGSLSIDNYSVKPVAPYSNPSYMSPTQIQALAASGFEIGAHTMTHADLTALSTPGMIAEIEGARADLTALGLTPQTFVYPYGEYNTGIEQIVAADGFIGARTVDRGYNTSATNRYALMHQEVNLDTTLAEVQSWINAAAQNNTWLILTFHEVADSGGYYRTTPDTFSQIVELVQSADLTPVSVADGIAQLS